MTPPPRVSVVIPAYYSDATIADCLTALRQQTFRDFEVMVVNSSPEERTQQIVTQQFPEVRFEQSKQRLLPHAARNRGVDLSRGELLVFTDPDCVAHPAWLACLVAASDAGHPVVQGSMGLQKRSWFERGVHLCKWSALLSGVPPHRLWLVATSNACYRRDVWEAAGPFDGSVYGGDALLSWRAAARGYELWFEPRAIVEHHHGGSLAGLWRERLTRGAEFAQMRSRFEQWSRGRTLGNAVALPMLLLQVLGRAGRDAARSGWLMSFLTTLPLQIIGQLAWSLGEARVHWSLLRNRAARA